MVSLSLNKKVLLKDLGVQETPELLHQVAMMGVEIDENTPEEMVVDITPNRPDLLSQPGFTRALAAFIGKAPGLRGYITTPSKLKVIVDESTKGIRPFTACAVIRNLKLDEEKLKEIIDIQEKLHTTFCRRRKKAAIGIYPMEAISGNITFLAMEPSKIKFRPLEADTEMTAKQILTEHPKGKEFAHLVDGLPKYALFMDSKKRVLSMPPLINSHETGKITIATTEAFLECSGFDFRTCHEVIQIICAALADMGASIHTVEVVYTKKTEITPDMTPKRQEFYGYYVNRRLGVSLRKEDLAPLLSKMGLGFEEWRIKDTFYALLPPYRVDFLHQIDVVEDIAIAMGYDHITPVLPQVATTASERPATKFDAILRKVLVGQGLLEAKNYHLTSGEFQIEIEGNEMVTLRSSVSEEYNVLRSSLLPVLLQTLARNKQHEYPQSFFEIGTVFTPATEHVDETEHLAVVMAGGEMDYTRVRQSVDGVLLALGLTGKYTEKEDRRFISGRCAELVVDGAALGLVGELSPRIITHAGIAVPIAYAEIDVDVLRLIRLG
jgi:phenylalanyl-tRNA synthetase beta chain